MISRRASCFTPRLRRGMSAPSTMPDLAAGHRGLFSSLAFGLALDPGTTWVSPSSRLACYLDDFLKLGPMNQDVLNHQSVKMGQVQWRVRRGDRSRQIRLKGLSQNAASVASAS